MLSLEIIVGLHDCVRFLQNCSHVVAYNVTGPAKTGHMGTNYTLSHNRSYHSTETEYLHFVTCIINPVKCLLRAEICIAIV